MRTRHLLPLAAALALLAGAPAAFAQEGEGDPVRGGELFVANCAVCHGVDGKGRIGASLEAFPGIDVGASLETIITQGVPGSVMPAWGQANGGPLSQKDIRDIAAYIVEVFGGTQPITPLPTYVAPTIERLPDVKGDPSAGAVVFQENCVMCHGRRGEGRFGVALAKAWPSPDPATYIRQVVGQGIDGTTMPAWAQANGGPLSDESIADVAAYVLTLEPLAQPTPPAQPVGPMSARATWILLGGLAAATILVLVVYFRRSQAR